MNNNEENVDMEEEVILEEASYRLSRSASAALAMGFRHALFNNETICIFKCNCFLIKIYILNIFVFKRNEVGCA